MTTRKPIEKSVARGDAEVRRALRLRILSAAVLIPPVILAIFWGGRLFTAMVAFAAMLMVFEWTRMVEGRAYSWRFYLLSASAAAALIAASAGAYLFALGVAALGGLLVLAPIGGFTMWPAIAAPYIVAPSVALIWLRFDPVYGGALTALVFITVWAADTGAFIFGKLLGGPKISYALSPSKTWAGIGGGVAGGALMGAAGAYFFFGPGAALGFLLPGGILGAASVAGDLAESALKRRFRVKDISGFIPGHGGVLDRLDGMIFATVTMTSVYLLYTLFGKLQG
ncbi:MAG: phosphatidate cytidylyltransferase [Pseudomonadota bacterium]